MTHYTAPATIVSVLRCIYAGSAAIRRAGGTNTRAARASLPSETLRATGSAVLPIVAETHARAAAISQTRRTDTRCARADPTVRACYARAGAVSLARRTAASSTRADSTDRACHTTAAAVDLPRWAAEPASAGLSPRAASACRPVRAWAASLERRTACIGAWFKKGRAVPGKGRVVDEVKLRDVDRQSELRWLYIECIDSAQIRGSSRSIDVPAAIQRCTGGKTWKHLLPLSVIWP